MLARGETSRQAVPGGRPRVIRLLVAWLVLLSVLQLATGAGLPVPVFPADRAASRVVYGLAGLWVAVLLWRRHPRARFAAYVLLTLQALRALRGRQWPALLVALAGIALLQVPAARRFAPPIRPAEVRRRLLARIRRPPLPHDDRTRRPN
jgi:hypothetical protein